MINKDLERFKEELKKEEKLEGTINQYSGYIEEFIDITKIKTKEEINKTMLIEYKEQIKEKHNGNVNSINIKILIINKFITFLGLPKELRLKQEKQQKQTTLENVLTPKEYEHLRTYAKAHRKDRLYHIMGTLEGTGIRISELQYITVEGIKKQEADIYNKGKWRKIPIQDRVKKELLQYCREKNITEGVIFRSRNGNPLDASYIWKELKKLAGQVRSGLKKSKVYPHSFRHLFAKEFLDNGGNLTDLGDILGHESLETTRIYTTKSVAEQRETLNKMYKRKNK